MRDFWAFLMQTLTATGVAALLLLIKEIFRDKLSPRWQFGIWSLLGVVLLLPAGWGGRYVLADWPLLVETVKSTLAGDYGLTTVIAPIPLLPTRGPETVWDWLFLAYGAGVLVCLVGYGVSYIRLRAVLRQGRPIDPEMEEKLHRTQALCGQRVDRAVAVPGLRSAFVCGLVHPVLVLPAGVETDEKVLLHELLHVKHRDVAWGVVICFFRCIHWCNPLLWYCANRAGNDLESLCDQRVLERLEGEDRRDYGRILLSMANETYARTPGTSSIANGGKNIRRRIEAIARFKRYPAGMALVSVCIGIVLLSPMVMGVRGGQVHVSGNPELVMASTRRSRCTTPAGALDAYAKGMLTRREAYYAMCAPLSEQGALAEELKTHSGAHPLPWERAGVEFLDQQEGYYLYGLEPVGEKAYETLLVMKPQRQLVESNRMRISTQTLRVEREGQNWVVRPTTPMVTQELLEESISWSCRGLPAKVYSGQAQDFKIEVFFQQQYSIDNQVQPQNSGWMGGGTGFDLVPRPDAQFDTVKYSQWLTCTYVGDEGAKDQIHHLGVSYRIWEEGEERPICEEAISGDVTGSGNHGAGWCGETLSPGWASVREMGGGGSSAPYEEGAEQYPQRYAADLYLNEKKVAELTLLPEEGAR